MKLRIKEIRKEKEAKKFEGSVKTVKEEKLDVKDIDNEHGDVVSGGVKPNNPLDCKYYGTGTSPIVLLLLDEEEKKH